MNQQKQFQLSDKQRQLVEENHNLIYAYLNAHQLSVEEYYDLAAIGLCYAAHEFDPSKAQFSTWAWTCMDTRVYHQYLYANRKHRIPEYKLVSYDAAIDTDDDTRGDLLYANAFPSVENTENDAIFSVLMEKIKDSLSPKDLEVFELLLLGYNTIEIGKMMGLSNSRIRQIRERIRDKILIKIGHIKEFQERRYKCCGNDRLRSPSTSQRK